MRISFILSSLWLSGGVQVILEYANRLSERGHLIHLVSPGNVMDDEIARIASPSIFIHETGTLSKGSMNIPKKLRLSFDLARKIPACDVMIATHTPTTFVSLLSQKLFHHRGIPIWFYMDYPGMFRNPSVEMWLLKNAMRWHKAAFVLSKYSTQELASFTRKEIIPVGLGLSYYELLKANKSERPFSRDLRTILYLGDFRARKGFQDFLKAAALVYEANKSIELWIAMKEAGEIHTHIPFKYFIRPSAQQLAELYATCDLFVSASWYEGFGLPPLEAMACGAPVVLTNSGGVQDFASPGKNCLMVPAKQPAALADAMLQILNHPELAQAFRTAGPLTAANFTWDSAVDRFESALFRLVS
jgi:glycosyltransferase involved in cell wall biosynthesis